MKNHTSAIPQVEIEFRLACIWQSRGRLERAIEGYRNTLSQRPDYIPAYLKLGGLMVEQQCLSEAVDLYDQALTLYPNEAELHKCLVNAIAEQGDLRKAFQYYRLERRDTKRIEIQPQDLLCCAVVRNEQIHLPYFLSYYRQKGIRWFLIVDNDSEDGTLPYLLEQPDVYTWHSPLSFNRANFGAGWFELLLREYGQNHWCLIVDADELLYYPGCEGKNLVELCHDLDRKKKRAFSAVLLDMYSDKPITDTHYAPCEDPLKVCPFFDQKFYHTQHEKSSPFKNQTFYFGGARQRIFGEKEGDFLLSKVPLIKYHLDFILSGGQHWTNRPELEIAKETGCLLHFKYFSTFLPYVEREIKRKEHYGVAMQYGLYAQALLGNKGLILYDEKHSVRFQDSQQLLDFGIMQEDTESKNRTEDKIEFPSISPCSQNIQRPFWSVMITVYDRVNCLERALRSVLDQAPGMEEMQIEVLNDGSNPSVHAEIKRIVQTIGGDRVQLHLLPDHIGHPHIFNLCIQRALGYWIHILHDDDWVKPGFYSSLRMGMEKEVRLGAAFCRHIRIDETGQELWVSWLERETPGIIDHWLERIAIMCRLQFVSIVVKRSVYERLGGFCPQANSAFDWEMWKRIAVHYPFWYEPHPLAFFSHGRTSATHHLIKSGGQIADALKSIEISQSYLPSSVAETFSHRAKEYYGLYAFELAKEQMTLDDYSSAFANIREGLRCCQSERVKQKLVGLFTSK